MLVSAYLGLMYEVMSNLSRALKMWYARRYAEVRVWSIMVEVERLSARSGKCAHAYRDFREALLRRDWCKGFHLEGRDVQQGQRVVVR